MILFSTGEVAKKLNMTIRTLRYYDKIGLVVPSLKKENGTRYYSEDDMLLLEKIALLKSTSLSLKDIKTIIDQVTTEEILTVHKMQLETTIEQLNLSLQHTTTLLNTLKLEGKIQWDQLSPIVSDEEKRKKQDRKKQLWSQLFSNEENSILSANLPKLEDPLTIKWVNIVKRVQLCLDNGNSPSSIEGQLIAVDVDLLAKESFGDNPDLIKKFWEVRKSEETSAKLDLYPVNKEVLIFLEEAIFHYDSTSAK
ncbi:MerR family transcriptional regulator [Evansella sp. AB-rgal1]|uniref:MerR family transcriptional regulator n=1 Tax=Evansella sp. AB-rgal1 TaxID=3242696 RepID=UPI00359E5807